MKFLCIMGLDNDIAKTIFTKSYKSLDDLYFGALKVELELKANATPPRAHFATTKFHDDEHLDGTTKMSMHDELEDDAPKSEFTSIPRCGIDYAESTTILFEDSAATTMSTKQVKEHALEASDKVASKDVGSIFGGESEMIKHGIFPSVREESDDVPSSAFIHDDGDDMVEHGSFPSTMTAFGDELKDFCHHIES
ncbi:gag-pol polyprotein [Hordeum vulgare]|nr:gag-pol polyprotein [Hordeum vulgare]